MGRSLLLYAAFVVFVVIAFMAGDGLGTSELTKKLIPALLIGVASIAASRTTRRGAMLPTDWGGLILLPWLWVVANAIRYRPTGLPDPSDLVILMSTVFLAGIAEELACRYSMHRILGPVCPALFLLLNSLVFGLLHAYQGWLGMAVNVLVGATFDIARMRGASMWMLIVCHSLINVPDRLPHVERAAGVPCTWMTLGAVALVWLVFLGPRFWRSTPEAVNEAADLDANRP